MLGRKKRGATKFNPETASKILTFVRAGNYPDTAAAFCGVSSDALRAWLRDGRDGKTDELEQFAEDLMSAEATAEISAVAEMRRSPREARKFLERRFATRWGPKAQINLGTADGPLQINFVWQETKGRG